MEQENSAGVIVFYYNPENKEPYFLILKYTSYWGFAKGWIDGGENEKQTAKREVKEEAGIDVELIEGFKEIQRWFFRSKEGSLVRKDCVYFIAEVSRSQAEDVKISEEHEDFRFVTLEESKKYVKIKANKELLQKAYKFIKDYKKQKKLF